MKKENIDNGYTAEYLEWLHSVTVLGYDKGLLITKDDEPTCQLLYAHNVNAADAVLHLIQRLREGCKGGNPSQMQFPNF